MPLRNWGTDDEVMRGIADILCDENLKRLIAEAGRTVGAWYAADPDRALADLLCDSCLDDAPAIRRSVRAAPRSLVFALGGLRVEVELSDTGIEGQLVPPQAGRVWLLDATGPVAETTVDAVGCFEFPAGRRGPFRIECAIRGGRRLATEWITV